MICLTDIASCANLIDWQIVGLIGGALLFAGLMVEMARRDRQKWGEILSLGEEAVEAVIEEEEDYTQPFVPEFSSVDAIHAHYAALKETDPKAAGEAMYQAQLKLHGR